MSSDMMWLSFQCHYHGWNIANFRFRLNASCRFFSLNLVIPLTEPRGTELLLLSNRKELDKYVASEYKQETTDLEISCNISTDHTIDAAFLVEKQDLGETMLHFYVFGGLSRGTQSCQVASVKHLYHIRFFRVFKEQPAKRETMASI